MSEGTGVIRSYHQAGIVKIEDCTFSTIQADTLCFLMSANYAIDASIIDPSVDPTYVLFKG